jgi:hypothetical protein
MFSKRPVEDDIRDKPVTGQERAAAAASSFRSRLFSSLAKCSFDKKKRKGNVDLSGPYMLFVGSNIFIFQKPTPDHGQEY